MSRDAPSAPWTYPCEVEGCDYSILVHNRGAHGNDPGAGVEACASAFTHRARCQTRSHSGYGVHNCLAVAGPERNDAAAAYLVQVCGTPADLLSGGEA